jgi:histidinol-phosphate aminotransferase
MSYFRPNIEKMNGYVPGLQPTGDKITKLNTNENPYPPSPKVMEAIGGVSPDRLRRYPSSTCDAFREEAAKVNRVPPESILCCNGGDEMLTIAVRSFCGEGRPLAYPTPTYSLYPVLAASQNCPGIEVEFDESYNLPGELLHTGAKLTILCNPNAPSGSFVEPSVVQRLAGEFKGKSVLLVDEAYVDFASKNCAHLAQANDNVIILRSMSKGYSLAGLRFGYAIASKELIRGLEKVKDSYNVDALSIAAATAAIKDQEYFLGNIEKVKSERARLTNALCDLGFKVPESQANFILAQCIDRNAAQAYKELTRREIYVRYFDLPRLEDKLRITVGTKDENDALLKALKEILHADGDTAR